MVAPQTNCKVPPAQRFSRAMVVDDSYAMRMLTGRILQSQRIATLQYNDGFDAWRAIQNHRVDILITDIEMPIWSGLDLLHHMRRSSQRRLRELPAIVVSSVRQRGVIRMVHSMPNTFMLSKPISAWQLEIMLRMIETSHWLRR